MQAHNRGAKYDFDSERIAPLLTLAYDKNGVDPGFRNNLQWNLQFLHAHSSGHCIYRRWAVGVHVGCLHSSGSWTCRGVERQS